MNSGVEKSPLHCHWTFLTQDSSLGQCILALLDRLVHMLDRLVAVIVELRLGIFQGMPRLVKIRQGFSHVWVIIHFLYRHTNRSHRVGSPDNGHRPRADSSGNKRHEQVLRANHLSLLLFAETQPDRSPALRTRPFLASTYNPDRYFSQLSNSRAGMLANLRDFLKLDPERKSL
jgi:hypothetical protein